MSCILLPFNGYLEMFKKSQLLRTVWSDTDMPGGNWLNYDDAAKWLFDLNVAAFECRYGKGETTSAHIEEQRSIAKSDYAFDKTENYNDFIDCIDLMNTIIYQLSEFPKACWYDQQLDKVVAAKDQITAMMVNKLRFARKNGTVKDTLKAVCKYDASLQPKY